MLFCIVWRRRYLVAALILGFVLVRAAFMWPSLQERYDSQPRQGELAQVDITGEWHIWRCEEAACLTVHEPLGGGAYRVAFGSYGSLGRLEMDRTGCYADGVLTLDRPVFEYGGTTYRRLYTLRVGGTEYLVPDVRLGRFRRSLTRRNELEREAGVILYSFSKRKPLLWRRLESCERH